MVHALQMTSTIVQGSATFLIDAAAYAAAPLIDGDPIGKGLLAVPLLC
jgi:hypothetical protein